MKVAFNSVALAVFYLTNSVGATPRALPFTYPNETLSQGEVEVESYVDVNPLRTAADANDPTLGNVWNPEYTIQTEIEYGITDRWELGLYQVFKAEPAAGGDNSLGFDGLKWRLRTRVAEPGELPVDLGFYLELETMHDEVSLEGKVNLQRRIGRATWMANLWAEESLSRPLDSKLHGRQAHFIINPTSGIVFQVTPTFQPGVEFWARGELSANGLTPQDRENSRVHYFAGPTLHLNFGRFWGSIGLYLHANNMHTPEPGDAYGPVWFRYVLGLEL